MEGYVGRIEIQDDIPRGYLKALKEYLAEEIFDLLLIPIDLAVTILLDLIVLLTQFQMIEGTLTGSHFLLAATDILDERILAKFFVVVDVLIALDNTENPLGE